MTTADATDPRDFVRTDGDKTWIRVHVQRHRHEMDGPYPGTRTEDGRYWRDHWTATGLTTLPRRASYCDSEAEAMR